MQELRCVNDWVHLGVFLEVTAADLMSIRHGHASLLERKSEMLRVCMERAKGPPTWGEVVHALLAIGMRSLATEIAMKHGKMIWKGSCTPD